MLTLFGIDYIIDHVLAEIKKQNEEKAYKIYITDSLRAITNNIAQEASQERYYSIMPMRWIDIIDARDEPQEQEDPRSCEEIAADIWKKIRGKGEK